MQHPVGYKYNPDTGRAELDDFVKVLTNSTQLVTFPHVVSVCYLTGGAFVAGVALFLMVRRSTPPEDVAMYRGAVRVGAWVLVLAGIGVCVTGDIQGKIMTDQQPMKMAAAEALYDTSEPASFSLFTIGSLSGDEERFSIRVPGLLSFLATGSFNGEVEGINQLRDEYEQTYGEAPGASYYNPSDYVPYIPVTYWSFRLMIGLGAFASLVGAVLLWLLRGGRIALRGRRWVWAAVALPFLPVFGSSFGWVFTEMGRQPWLVFGVLTTPKGVSPGVSSGEVLTSLIVFTLLYGVLAVVEIGLTAKYVKVGADPYVEPPDPSLTGGDADRPLSFAY
jgi:cytochrome d ubiquinol oxidase subunit I